MPDIDVTGYDDPLTEGTDEGTTDVNGLIVSHPTGGVVSGTGGYTPFLRQNDQSGTTTGFNTDDPAATANNNSGGLDMDASWTQSLRLGDIPIVIIDGVTYYEIRLDLNEENNDGSDSGGDPNRELELSELQIYWSENQATLADFNTGSFETRALDSDFNLAFDLDSGEDRSLILIDGDSGSGRDDYVFYIPVTAFAGADPDSYFTLFSQFGPQPQEGATFEEWRIQNVERVDGVKFADLDGNGQQDVDGADNILGNDDDEIGLAGFTMYIDANGNNILDAGEITAVSGADGSFTFFSLTAGTYVIREDLTDAQELGYILTTGDGGNHVVTITEEGDYTVSIGNMPTTPAINVVKSVVSVEGGHDNGTALDLTDDLVNSAGDVIHYQITIENTGNVALSGVTVTDQVEGYAATGAIYASGDTNTNNILDVDETWTYTASYTVEQEDIDAAHAGDGTIDNVAVGDTTQTDEDSDDEEVEVLSVASIDVTKSVVSVEGGDDNETVGDLTDDMVDSAGDVIHYSIAIENTGNVTLTGVTVTDQVEAYTATNATYVSGDTDEDGDLDVDETWIYSASYEVQQADIDDAHVDDGDIDNVAVGDTDQTGQDSDEEDVEVLSVASIDVTKTVVSVIGGNDNATPGNLTDDLVDSAGDIINYSITIENTGNVTLTGVTVTDQVESHGAVNATYESGDTDEDGELDVDETWTYSATYEVTQDDIDAAFASDGDDDIDNLAVGDTDQTGEDSDEADVEVLTNPAIDVTKSVVSVDGGDDNSTPLDLTDDLVDSAGDVIHYSITIENTGNVALSGVTVTDQVEGYAETNATYVSGDTDEDGLLDTDETWTYSASYEVQQADIDDAHVDDGDIDNVAVGDTTETESDSDEEDVEVLSVASIDVTKSVVSVEGGHDNGTALDLTDDLVNSAGDVINYSITIENTGNVTLTGVTVTDEVEAYGAVNATYVSGDTDEDGNLDVDETWTYTATYEVEQADIDAAHVDDGDIDNVAIGDTDQTEEDSDEEDVEVLSVASIDVVKSVVSVEGGNDNETVGDLTDDLVDSAGDIINYSITIENTGNVTLTGVEVTDQVETYTATNATYVSGDTDEDGELDVDETWTYSASYEVQQSDIDLAFAGDGTIDNVAVGDTDQTGEDSDEEDVEVLATPAIDVTKTVVSVEGGHDNGTALDLTDDLVDSADDVINYSITIENTGNVTLSGVEVTDQVEAYAETDAVYVSGDTDEDSELDVDETWTYTASYTVTQDDIDDAHAGDGHIDNVAVGDTDQTGEDSDLEDVEVLSVASMEVVKSVVSVEGGDDNATALDLTDDRVDSAGDVINYSITVENTGNVTLTGVDVTDQVEAYGATDALYMSGDTNLDGELDVDETWTYSASYEVTQDDIDAAFAEDGTIDNVAVADSNETDEDSDDEDVVVLTDPSIDLEKEVSVDGPDGTFVDADTADLGPENVNIGDPVWFEVSVTNDGNVSLTDLVITDVNTSNGGNASVTLYDGGTLLAGATLTGDDNDGDAGNGLVADGILQVGETWTITYSAAFDPGEHVNTADVVTTQGATDSDAAHYFSLIDEGPGVRTPGFWKNLGSGFWDGEDGLPKQAGQPGFPDAELVYDIFLEDTNEDGVINDDDEAVQGLLIGDYNKNGIVDEGEDAFFISLDDAKILIDASNKQMSDGVVKIGRDAVATWLNYLAGNNIGSAGDDESPKHFINDAIDWLQMYGDDDAGTGDETETFDAYNWLHAMVKSASSGWTADYPGGDHSGAEIHAALDYYNNTGMTSPDSAMYAHDADSESFMAALEAVAVQSSRDYVPTAPSLPAAPVAEAPSAPEATVTLMHQRALIGDAPSHDMGIILLGVQPEMHQYMA